MVILLFRTFIFYVLLTALIRLMGKRQLGELQITELIIALMLSDIAVIPITDRDIPLLHGVIPALALTSFELLMSYACTRSRKIQRFITGSPIILMSRGTINEDNLDSTHITVEELFSEIRTQGYADISEIQYIIFEPSGKLSVIPFAKNRSLTPTDQGIDARDIGIAHPIILNGEINAEALKAAQKSEEWLKSKLKSCGSDVCDILYMTINDKGESKVHLKNKERK